MEPLIVRNGTVVSMGRPGVVRADVLIEGEYVTAVGTGLHRPGMREIDATGRLVMPGLVQSHVHLCQTAFRGLSDDLRLVPWLHDVVWPLEQALDASAAAASARWGIADLLLSGSTSFLAMESAQHLDETFEAAADLGARAVIGRVLRDGAEPGTTFEAEPADEAWADLRRLVDTWHGRDNYRLRASVAPPSPRAATPELWDRALTLAAQRDLVVQTHAGEGGTAGRGTGDVHRLAALDALGPSTVLATCVDLDDDERDLLRRTGTRVAHCPSADLRLRSAVADVPDLLRRGLTVGLGSESAAASQSLDVFGEMRLTALLHRTGGAGTAVSAERALRMATVDGAALLGLAGSAGVLDVGHLADVTIVDAPQVTGPHLALLATDHLVFSATGADVRTVLVSGRVVVDEGRLVRADAGQVRAAGTAARDWLAGRLTPIP